MNTPSSSKKGLTLVEIVIASAISTIVIGAVLSIVITGLKIYYVESDYLDIEGSTRRLVDDMIESGTVSDNETDFKDVAVFDDIKNLNVVPKETRGDVLMFYTRVPAGPGNISKFTCYYLRRTPPVGSDPSPISVWRFTGKPKTATSDVVKAITDCTRENDKQVSGTVFRGSLPRADASASVPREGLFTYIGVGSVGSSPTVLVNLPANLSARGTVPPATSNMTIAITPRH